MAKKGRKPNPRPPGVRLTQPQFNAFFEQLSKHGVTYIEELGKFTVKKIPSRTMFHRNSNAVINTKPYLKLKFTQFSTMKQMLKNI
jgi:nucleoid DNA-binding protein